MTGLVVAIVVVATVAVLLVYLVWLGGRHDRLTARTDGAWAALDAQLVRRAAAARALALVRGDAAVVEAAEMVLTDAGHSAPSDERQDAENALGRALRGAGYESLDPAAGPTPLSELRSSAQRVLLARQFHNDAVRDLMALRHRPAARLARWGRGGTQRYFEIDDTVLTGVVRSGTPGSGT